jgi:hypothetical protein
MEHNSKIASPRVLAAVVEKPVSRFELYHALKVIEDMTLIDPPSPDLAHLLSIVKREQEAGRMRGPHSDGHSDVDMLAQRILARSGQ